MQEKYYKVIGPDGFSPSAKFDYSQYLPSENTAGAWLPEIEDAKLHDEGYYISQYWNMWYADGCKIYEVEFDGAEAHDDFGVEHQLCCKKIRLVKDATRELLEEFFADGDKADLNAQNWNTGKLNTGARNIGNCNPGNFNTGNRNTGDRNRGDFNTGDCNTGIDNVGDNNSGSCNVGSRNVGHHNTGDDNKGSYNSGSGNIGNGNVGSFNKGNRNVGKWNIGNGHVGFFNTAEPFAYMFNKPTGKKYSEIILPKWLNKKDLKSAFAAASREELEATLNLPNFDHSIFEELTGISKSDFDTRLKDL